MKLTTKSFSTFLFATLASLGLVASALAQNPLKAPPAPGAANITGLLGSTYAGAAWNYYWLNDGPPSVAHGMTAYFNQALSDDLDLGVIYERTRTKGAGLSATEQKVALAATSYAKATWGKTFFSASIDRAWRRGDVIGRKGSWGIGAEGGIEAQVAQNFVLTPFIGWDRETGFNRNAARLGARATLHICRELSLTGQAQWLNYRRAADRAEYSVGMNYHF